MSSKKSFFRGFLLNLVPSVHGTQCLKITEKVSFYNISSDASFYGQTALPDMSILKGQKLLENAKIEKFIWDILTNFKTMCGLKSF